MDKISVIIPVYNVEKYLDECLTSVVNQRYKNLEIILVDDGSTDNGMQVCKRFASNDSRIVVYEKNNQGPGETRNFGLNRIHGKYFTFIDADDFVSENYIFNLYHSLKNANADLSICDYSTENINNTISSIEELDNYALIEKMICGNTVFSVCWGKLFKTKKFGHLRFNNFLVSEDELYMQNVFTETNKAIFCKSKLYYYRTNPEGIICGSFSQKKLSAIDALEQRERFLVENNFKDLFFINRVSLLYKIIFLYFQAKSHVDKKELLELQHKYKKYYKFDKSKIGIKNKFWLTLFKISPGVYNLVYKINKGIKCKKK